MRFTFPTRKLSVLLFLAALTAGTAHAQDSEVTIQVIPPDAQVPEVVTGEIRLPDEAAPEAHENAAAGLHTANQAREMREEFGRETADAAREGREEFGRDLGAEARETRDRFDSMDRPERP